MFCLIMLELLMIFAEPYLFHGFYQYDPDLGFRVRPYANGTNRFGFNDHDYPLQKKPSTFRILVVGDSFSWRGGKDKNYTALLEGMFEQSRGGHAVDVINTGYPMTHTAEQLEMLKKYGLQYNPDLVFLGFFIGNDFLDADPNRKRVVLNNVYFDIDKRWEFTFLGYPIVPMSRLALFVKQKYTVFRNLDKSRKGTFTYDCFLKTEKGRMDFFNVDKQRAGIYRQNIDYIFQSIDGMKELLDSRNIKFVVGIYPDEFHVNENLLHQIFTKFELEKEHYELMFGQNLLKRYLESKKIQYIDMTEEFRAEGKKKPLYLPRDTHWNEAGNELAAKIIFKKISEFVQ